MVTKTCVPGTRCPVPCRSSHARQRSIKLHRCEKIDARKSLLSLSFCSAFITNSRGKQENRIRLCSVRLPQVPLEQQNREPGGARVPARH